MNHAGNVSLAPDDGLQNGFRGIGHDLGVHILAPLEQAKDHGHGLVACAPTSQAPYPARPEVQLIGFELAAQRRNLLAMLGQVAACAQVNGIDRAH